MRVPARAEILSSVELLLTGHVSGIEAGIIVLLVFAMAMVVRRKGCRRLIQTITI